MVKKKIENQLLLEELRAIRKELSNLLMKDDLKDLKKDITELIALLRIIVKRQKVLEKKMMEIEDYFDPHPKN